MKKFFVLVIVAAAAVASFASCKKASDTCECTEKNSNVTETGYTGGLYTCKEYAKLMNEMASSEGYSQNWSCK